MVSGTLVLQLTKNRLVLGLVSQIDLKPHPFIIAACSVAKNQLLLSRDHVSVSLFHSE